MHRKTPTSVHLFTRPSILLIHQIFAFGISSTLEDDNRRLDHYNIFKMKLTMKKSIRGTKCGLAERLCATFISQVSLVYANWILAGWIRVSEMSIRFEESVWTGVAILVAWGVFVTKRLRQVGNIFDFVFTQTMRYYHNALRYVNVWDFAIFSISSMLDFQYKGSAI